MGTNHVPGDFAALTGIDDLDRWPLSRFILTEEPYPGSYSTQEPCLTLDDVVMPKRWRGRGVGTAVLDAVCLYADARALAVWLSVKGSGRATLEGTMNTVRLVTWYRRFGFTDVAESEAWRWHCHVKDGNRCAGMIRG
jgi:GNAT superfamily N-acetyltransferase